MISAGVISTRRHSSTERFKIQGQLTLKVIGVEGDSSLTMAARGLISLVLGFILWMAFSEPGMKYTQGVMDQLADFGGQLGLVEEAVTQDEVDELEGKAAKEIR